MISYLNTAQTKEHIDSLKEKLIQKAREKYGDIYPCYPYSNMTDSFTFETIDSDIIIFWFMDVSSEIHIEYTHI